VVSFGYQWFLERHGLTDSLAEIARVVQPAKDGPWFVGGSVRRVVMGDKQSSDFDIACKDEAQCNALKERLCAAGFELKRQNDFHVEFRRAEDGATAVVQALLLFRDDVESVLDSFDFTICQFGYDGERLVCGELAMWDLARKRLALHRMTYGASTVRRLLKYGRQGFTACQGTIVSILTAVVENPDSIRGEVEYID